MVHKGEIVIKTQENGGWEFLNAEGHPYHNRRPKNPPVYDWNEIHCVHEENGIYIDAQTAVTRWRGEKMDYDMALFCLFNQRDRHRERQGGASENVSAETLVEEELTEQNIYGWTLEPSY